ncbi:hypothetical protein PR048_032887 [Dryococelus australis]|uniref:Uncharacterized protein n=1 Tax=Dryococelus australis TaxID=614101 RepID=A0ABQ9G3H0_9NEOP|nr:hypothetical protein PR048_032887 [Dryococelus australis]
MERRWNARAGETGVPQENPPASGIVLHDSHVRKSGIEPGASPNHCATASEKPRLAGLTGGLSELRRDVQGVLTSGLCVLCGLERETSSARREIQLLQPNGWYKGPSTPPALSFGNDERDTLTSVPRLSWPVFRRTRREAGMALHPTADVNDAVLVRLHDSIDNASYSPTDLATNMHAGGLTDSPVRRGPAGVAGRLQVGDTLDTLPPQRLSCITALGESNQSQPREKVMPQADAGEARSVRSRAGMQGPGKPEIPEKTRRTAASSDAIPTYENAGVTAPDIEPGLHWWEARSLPTTPPRPCKGSGRATGQCSGSGSVSAWSSADGWPPRGEMPAIALLRGPRPLWAGTRPVPGVFDRSMEVYWGRDPHSFPGAAYLQRSYYEQNLTRKDVYSGCVRPTFHDCELSGLLRDDGCGTARRVTSPHSAPQGRRFNIDSDVGKQPRHAANGLTRGVTAIPGHPSPVFQSLEPIRVKRDEYGGAPIKREEETGNPRENPLTSDIVRHESHVRKLRNDPAGNRTQKTGAAILRTTWLLSSHARSRRGLAWKARHVLSTRAWRRRLHMKAVRCVTAADPDTRSPYFTRRTEQPEGVDANTSSFSLFTATKTCAHPAIAHFLCSPARSRTQPVRDDAFLTVYHSQP